MNEAFINKIYKEHQTCSNCPSPQEVAGFFKRIMSLLYVDFSQSHFDSKIKIQAELEHCYEELLSLLVRNSEHGDAGQKQITDGFFERLPVVYQLLDQDIDAIFQGDPAAKSRKEVIRSYPGFYGIAAYRIAHELHLMGVPDIPRIITEHAHGISGIDIHPGAIIGNHFCIDHGTGVVIGETATIGNWVKIYQGVTLGALSVNKELANIKRHPTIENGCVIYAGSTILGGETVVGENSIIGGNVWLTQSVNPNSKVYYQAKMNHQGDGNIDVMVFKDYAK